MYKLSKLFTTTLVLTLFIFPTFSQEEIKIKGVKGVGVIAGRISFEDARREALNKAKVEALRQAGVSEQLQSYEMLFRSEVNNDFSEFFSSDIQSELRGAVKQYEIISTESKTNPDTKLPEVEVTLNATVILYTTGPDPSFNVKVEGIKGIYDDGEYLTFSIFSTKDCYLHIFGIADSYTSLLYPNYIENFKLIEANKTVTFPMGRVDYPLFKDTKEPEVTRVVFVFTKDPVRYLNFEGHEEQATTSEDIFSWIYSLMPEQRAIDYQIFTVR